MVVKGFDLHGRRALVVGAGSSVGPAIATTLAEAGADLVVTPCTGDAAERSAVEAAAADARSQGRAATVLSLDATDEDDVRRMVDEAVVALGGIDILVNNMDLAFASPITETSAEAWTRVISANLTGVFNTLKHVGRHMLEWGSGRIVNVASHLGERGLPNASAYCAAKGGVIQLTKAAALEWARQGITVNGVGLDWMEGDPFTQGGDEELRGRIARYVPEGRLGSADEAAVLAVYLASDASQYITGHTLSVDGGSLARL